MLRWSKAIACVTLWLTTGASAAQETEASDGAAEADGAQTELSFSSVDTGLPIQIVDGGPGRIPERDCRTPCRFRVPNGNYTLQAGSYEFEVTAAGGLQAWQVEDDDGNWLAVGIIGIVVGAAAAGFGTWGLVTYVPEESYDRDWMIGSAVATGLGGAALVGGIAAVAVSFGSAELISFSSTISRSATLTPRLAVFPDEEGVPAGWGFSLALDL